MRVELNKGIDIVSNLGGLKALEEAKALLQEKCDPESFKKIETIESEEVLIKIANAAAMMQPRDIWVNSGSEADVQIAREKSLENGEEFKISQGHTCHYDLPEDQGRLVKQTFYIVNEGEDISMLAKKELRSESLAYLKQEMVGIMKGRTMTVSFWNRGPIGAQPAIPAIMITDSYYVVHSGNILYPNVFPKFNEEKERAGVYFFNCHSYGTFKSEDVQKARVYMDRSWQTTYSMYCTYAGNTLMLKKGNHRFTVDHCIYERSGTELSEHMFITGLTGPGGRKTFFAGAAPSGCGKTTTAMVGTDFIGDDLAQLWINFNDGTVRAINPEQGIFGILRDVNRGGDPSLMKVLRGDIDAEVIFTNCLIEEDGTPRWVGDGDPAPQKGKNYIGEWTPDKKDKNGKSIACSHPNSRCTIPNSCIDNYNEQAATDPAGVVVRVITYSGRDSDTMPPIWVAKNADEGVVIGASIQSAATATEIGASGVRRQPWANQPFIPGSLADYMEGQLTFFNDTCLTSNQPIMAGLNYFLTHSARGGEEGDARLLGEKQDVKAWLSWLERRAYNDVEGIDSPIGYLPLFEDLQMLFKETINKEYTKELYDRQFSLYIDNILARIELQTEAYKKETNCPAILFQVYQKQAADLTSLKSDFGSIVTPDQLRGK